MIEQLFGSQVSSDISAGSFFLCLLCALIVGLILAACYTYRTQYTRSFVATLALLPAAVCVVIMMVNGNVGTGVAVAGAFSLVRFRSVPGTAKEIGAIFLAMGTGLIAGMGYLGIALCSAIILGLVSMGYSRMDFGYKKTSQCYRTLRITIPEDLDYDGVFDGILTDYASDYELVQVKTTNMGTLFRLTYQLTLRNPALEKELIDKLRCRNGNLEILISKQENVATEL